MKTKKQQLLLMVIALLPLFFFSSCDPNTGEDEKENLYYSITGNVQKGPYVKGTTITINELNELLNQTGRTFTTNISNNDGSFEIKNMELESNYVLLTAIGYYYNEVVDRLSTAPLTLQAIADLDTEATVNINVFTHIIKDRIIKLVGEGQNFKDATTTAQREFLQFLGVEITNNENFYELNLIGNTEYDAALLAFSIFVQRSSGSSLYATLTQLLNNLSEDFADNGQIDNKSLIDELLDNISTIHVPYVRTRLENKYKELGYENIDIPDFEKYIITFRLKYDPDFYIYTEYEYPEFARPYNDGGDGGETFNVLYKDKTEYTGYHTYSFAAIVPFGKTLQIRYSGTSGGRGIGNNSNWQVIDYEDYSIATAIKQNEVIFTSIDIGSEYGGGTGKLEYFENGDETPTYTKNFTWK